MVKLKAVKLQTQTIVRNKGVVSTLHNMINSAQEPGVPMVGVACVGVLADGTCVTAYEPGENATTLVGGLEYLKARIMRQIDGQ